MGQLPSSKTEVERIQRRSKKFFVLNGVLWRKNGDRPPLLVILSPDIQHRIVGAAHNKSGHRGRDPMFQKVQDIYWWPNLYSHIATHFHFTHTFQMRSTSSKTILL